MSRMQIRGVFALLVLSSWAVSAQAHVSLEILGEGWPTDMSADGSVIVGNTAGTYETWRWTAETGVVTLGQASTYLGVGAGLPGVSKDGTRVSATILSADSTTVTAGLWVQGQGWTDLLPPSPPDGAALDHDVASAWAISGDGQTVGGLYWRDNSGGGGSAHAFSWTESTGAVSLVPLLSGDSRVNGMNYDGSVIVGWSANPTFGNWWPTVWVNGAQTVLDSVDTWAEVKGCSDDGTILLGQDFGPTQSVVGAAVWRWNGSDWDFEYLGALFGTHPVFGNAAMTACTPDGSIMVGYNAYDPGNSAGIMWTEATGMVNIDQWLLAQGVTVPPDLRVLGLSAVSDDGGTICGYGQQTVSPYSPKFFKIHIDESTDAPVARGTTQLGQNYPNPFNPVTTVPVVMETRGKAELGIYDLRGQKVRTLYSGVLDVGRHEFRWDGQDESGAAVASGSYMARLQLDGGVEQSRRMVLIK